MKKRPNILILFLLIYLLSAFTSKPKTEPIVLETVVVNPSGVQRKDAILLLLELPVVELEITTQVLVPERAEDRPLLRSTAEEVMEVEEENLYKILPERTDCYFLPALEKVMFWKPLVDAIIEEYPFIYNSSSVEEDPSFLILGVIARESGGNPYVVSQDGHSTKGLMQVNDMWSEGLNLLVPTNNLARGMWLLNSNVERYQNLPDYYNPHYSTNGREESIFWGLSAYNCGYTSTDNGKCYWFGGPAYSEEILGCWVPALLAYDESLRQEAMTQPILNPE